MDQKLISVMKKLLVIISMLALAIGCETMYGPEQTPLTPDKTDGIAITVNSVADSTVSFTLAPVGEASYYSYLVDDSPKAVALDSSALIALQYSSVAQGTVKWSAEAPSKVVELKDLMPNTTYQIYAVTASPMGFVSSVAVTSFKTSDKEVPILNLKASEVADTLVTLTFSEDVVLAEGAQIIAAYYAINDPGFAQQTPVGVLPADTVYVKGNVVTAEFTSLPAGAYYAVNYAAGAIKDPAGNPAAVLQSAMAGDMSTGKTQGVGVYGRRELGTFEFGEYKEKIILDWKAPLLVDFGSEYGYGYTLKAAAATVEFVHSGRATTIDLVSGKTFGYAAAAKSIMLMLPEEPKKGDNLTFTVAADSFEDFYGNTNEEYVIELIYSYGYTLDNVVGLWANPGQSAFGAAYNEEAWPMVIEKSDDEKKGNVMITGYYMFSKLKIYALFDVDRGTLTMPINSVPLGGLKQSVKFELEDGSVVEVPCYLDFYTAGYNSTINGAKNNLILTMTEPGKFTTGNDYPGYVYDIYALPESGDPKDITEEDYVDYDYNVFAPVFIKVEAEASDVSLSSADVRKFDYKQGQQKRIELKIN